jgi:hypothetical protein
MCDAAYFIDHPNIHEQHAQSPMRIAYLSWDSNQKDLT